MTGNFRGYHRFILNAEKKNQSWKELINCLGSFDCPTVKGLISRLLGPRDQVLTQYAIEKVCFR